MRHIICLAQSKWSADPERTQQLMRLLNDVEISYFELTVTANITSYLKDQNTLEAREPHPGIKVYRVPTILFWKDVYKRQVVHCVEIFVSQIAQYRDQSGTIFQLDGFQPFLIHQYHLL